ncbi:MAG: AI-2E family transporter [Clostridia bacterium]|nr:AI-2E family transporter [Clostridia bacterium]
MNTLKARFIEEFKKNFKQILKAQLIIAGIAFVILLIGFSIMKIEHIFWISLGIAVVDLLPLVGSGVVLVPWAIYELFYLRHPQTALGLILMYVIIAIIHQILEPVLRGKSVGLAFVPTIVSSVIGYALFRLPGLIFAPVVVATTVNVYEGIKDSLKLIREETYEKLGINDFDMNNNSNVNGDIIDVDAKISNEDDSTPDDKTGE